MQLKCSGVLVNTKFYATTNMARACIVGLETCKDLKIVPRSFPYPQLNEVSLSQDKNEVELKEYLDKVVAKEREVFDNNGPITTMKFPPCHLTLRSDIKIKPYRVTSCRPSPIGRMEAERKELDRLESKNVIRKLAESETSEWLAKSHFVLKKDGSLRLVVNQIKLNQQLVRNAATFLTPFQQASQVPPNHKFFVSLDICKAYYQTEYDDYSQKLCAFLTPWGRYTFVRTIMGNVTSSDCLVERLRKAFKGLEKNVKCYIDDILISHETVDGVKGIVRVTIERCKEFGIQLSEKESKIQCGKKVLWAGLVISENGFSIDPRRYKAIEDSTPPRDKTELRSFLGTVNQLSQFAPDVALMTINVSELLGKRVAFNWLKMHQDEFVKCKKLLTGPGNKTMAFYDMSKMLRVFTDASCSGIGWCALQRKVESEEKSPLQMITCGSRKLRPNEQGWPILHLELLAVVTALKKMSLYTLFNPKVKIYTDHRPLESMLGDKGLEKESSRRVLFLKEQLSDYTFKIEFIKGKNNVIADMLSRRCEWQDEDEDELEGEVVNEISDSFMYQEMIKAARECSEYDMLRRSVQLRCDFGNLSRNVQEKLAPYKKFWNLLTMDSGIVLMNSRIVLPKSLRIPIIKRMHCSHNGVRRTIQTVRRIYYWPFYQSDVRNVILGCEECLTYAKSKPIEPIEHTNAKFPMHVLGIDIFFLNRDPYIAARDMFSGFLWCDKLVNMTSERIMEFLDSIFYMFGPCMELRHDGQTSFLSEEFRLYALKWKFESKVSSPYHSRSNGLAESGVKASELLLQKCNLDWKQFRKALLQYNNTALNIYGLPSPYELFMGRRGRTYYPMTDEQYEPLTDVEWKKIREAINRRDSKMIQDAGGKEDRTRFQCGDRVIVQNRNKAHKDYKKWITVAKVIEVINKRSYMLEKESDGKALVRNRRFLKPYTVIVDDDLSQPYQSGYGQVPERDYPDGIPQREVRQRRQPDWFGERIS